MLTKMYISKQVKRKQIQNNQGKSDIIQKT